MWPLWLFSENHQTYAKLVQITYKYRDYQVKVFHWKLAKQLHLLQKPYSPFYKYEPQVVLENVNYKLYWYRTLLRHKSIPFDRPH